MSALPFRLPPDLQQNLAPRTGGGAGGVYSDFERAQQAANEANRRRMEEIESGYRGIEEGYDARTEQMSQLLEGYGEAQRERQEMAAQKKRAGLQQDLINRGITSTSAALAQERAIDRDLSYEGRQLDDMLTRQKVEYLSRLTGEGLQARSGRLGFLERVEEGGPAMQDLQMLSQISGEGSAPVPDYLRALGTIQQQQQQQPQTGGPGPTPYGYPTSPTTPRISQPVEGRPTQPSQPSQVPVGTVPSMPLIYGRGIPTIGINPTTRR